MATSYTIYTRTGLNNTIFPEYIRIIGMWGGYCSNCKWPDYAISYY
jgi:hypothetical protein